MPVFDAPEDWVFQNHLYLASSTDLYAWTCFLLPSDDKRSGTWLDSEKKVYSHQTLYLFSAPADIRRCFLQSLIYTINIIAQSILFLQI